MSQDTTQDFTPLLSSIEDGLQDVQEGREDDPESIAMLSFADSVTGEKRELILYPEEEIRIGRRDSSPPSPTLNRRKVFNNLVIHDGRVSKTHFRVYSIIYEQKKNYETQTEQLPPLVYCEDLESSNGTYVNGNLIGIIGKEKVAHLLCDGDKIEIRPNWTFTFQQSNYQMIFPTSRQSEDMEHFVDRYTVSDRVLGSGKFGNVYLANDLSTKKQIACKIVDLESAMKSISESRLDRSGTGLGRNSAVETAYFKKQRKKVLLEIEILSRLTHPNIINITKAFCSRHALYIFTELATAGDLFSYAQSHGGHLDEYHGRVITKQIALALEYIHSQGIAHRDVKQENVLVTTTDFGGRVLLTDFGFATYTNARNGRMLSKVGTEGFVAPEVENVERFSAGYTKAADLWSLGVLTASLLTGGMALPHEELSKFSQIEIADRFLGVDDSYTRHQWIQMPPRALQFIRKLLVLQPEERMTAAEAVDHPWYTKPASEAQALKSGLQRINRFWQRRQLSGDEVLECLPGVVLSTPVAPNAPGPRFRRKLPDTTNSPYFGLDRHLNQKFVSGRKRLLDDLNESGSPFVTSPGAQPRKPVAKYKSPRNKGSSRVTSVEGRDIFGMSPLKKGARGRRDDIETTGLIQTTNVHQPKVHADDDDFSPMPRIEEQSGFDLSSHNRSSIPPGVKRAARSDSRSLSGRKRSINSLSGEAKTPQTLKDNQRYTTAEALRNTIGRMKL